MRRMRGTWPGCLTRTTPTVPLAVPSETGPADLNELVATQLRRVFVDDVTRTRRRLVVYGDPAWSALLLSEDRLIALAEELSL